MGPASSPLIFLDCSLEGSLRTAVHDRFRRMILCFSHVGFCCYPDSPFRLSMYYLYLTIVSNETPISKSATSDFVSTTSDVIDEWVIGARLMADSWV